MENRLKERLTGAAILVALIVLLVPEIFRGQRGDNHPSTAGSVGSEGAPLRSYTIDLSNKGNGPLQSTGDGAAAAAAADDAAVRQSTPNATVAPDATPPANGASKSVTKDSVSPATNQAPAPSPEPRAADSRPPPSEPRAISRVPVAPAATAHAVHPASAPSSAVSAAPTPPPKAGGNWSVQLGLFSKRENAERLAGEAHSKGFQTGISPDSRGQYRVRATGLADRAGAESLALRLKSAGLPAAVVAPK